ncbi:hypothetical protein Tco_0531215 [Tanacetum coccineum]
MLMITLIGSSTSLAYSIFLESLKTQSCSDFFPLLLLELQRDGGQTRPRNYQYLGSPPKGLYPKAWEQYNDLLYKCPTHDVNSHQKVRILQKSQENGQNRTNTDTRMDRVHKSRKFLAKGQQSQPLVNP